MGKRMGLAVLFTALVLGAAPGAQQGEGMLTAQDYAEIQQLYAHYAWSIDTRADNGMVYARTFTPDGEFVNGDSRTTGHEQLAAMIRGDGQPSPVPTHFTMNIAVESAPGGARGRAYLAITGGEPGGPQTLNTTGTYSDILVKTSEGWRFKQRTLYLTGLPPSHDE